MAFIIVIAVRERLNNNLDGVNHDPRHRRVSNRNQRKIFRS
jgi:hypothetical protein